jgi:hypothetical protein
LSHISSPFCSSYFRDGISWTSCPDWPWATILPISASQVTRIIGMDHWHPAPKHFWEKDIMNILRTLKLAFMSLQCLHLYSKAQCYKHSFWGVSLLPSFPSWMTLFTIQDSLRQASSTQVRHNLLVLMAVLLLLCSYLFAGLQVPWC